MEAREFCTDGSEQMVFVHLKDIGRDLTFHRSSDEICDVHGHFSDFGRVILLAKAQKDKKWSAFYTHAFSSLKKINSHVPEDAYVIDSHEADRNALATKASRASYPVEVVFAIERKIVIDDQADVLNIDAPSPDVGSD